MASLVRHLGMFASKRAGLLRCHALGCNQRKWFRATTQVSQNPEKLKWSYLHGETDGPLMGVTIGELMEQRAETHPDREAFIFTHQGIRRNFAQLLEESDELASGLAALGVQRGDRVGIWSPNYYEWILAQYGTARGGMILVNMNPAYQTGEAEYALKKVGLKAIICADKFKTQLYYNMLHSICPELENCTPGDLTSPRLPELKSVIVLGENKYPGALTFSELLQAGGSEQRNAIANIQKKLQFDDPINIQFTSGTTGQPKGATLTHHNIVNNSFYVGSRMDYQNKECRICVPVPLYHCFGMVLASLQTMTHGATCVFPSPSFDPKAALQAVEQERCTSLYGTPTMFIDMLQLPDLESYNVSTLYTGIMAGSPCPIEVMKQVHEKLNMDKVTIAYGTTENSPVTFQSFMTDPIEKRVTSVGKPAAHVELKVVDEDGHIVPVGEKGELCVRGYVVMRGYWDDPEKTAEVIDENRWYHTGDQAVMDEEGYGYIVGRIKDLIIRGGENIYPLEIEQLLYEHPDIADVQVIGVPNKRLGEEVGAWVKLKEGHLCMADDVKAFCKGKLAHFKIPKYVHFVNSFPLTVSGKVMKYKLREEAREMFGDD